MIAENADRARISDVSIVVPTYGREEVLIETITSLMKLAPAASEILIVDQTIQHEDRTTRVLRKLEQDVSIRWIRLQHPSIPRAMNIGLQRARSPYVLFVDDDVVPSSTLVGAHRAAHGEGIGGVVGQVLQPGETTSEDSTPVSRSDLEADLNFRFNSAKGAWVRSVIACNFSVERKAALAIGGFDENFVGAAYRFETEFARRLWHNGSKVWFEPAATLRHLRARRGGTRARGGHMASCSPHHGVGDYYFALREGRGVARARYIARRPLREIRTRFHLSHPWWIPLKFIGELRAIVQAVQLYRRGPRLIEGAP